MLPSWLRGWLERRRALGELAQFAKEEIPARNLQTDRELEEAKSALDRGDLPEAERLWNRASSTNPERIRDAQYGVIVGLGLSHFDEVENMLVIGIKRSPRNPLFHEGYAEAARRRGDYMEAAKRWRRVRKTFPLRSTGYHSEAACLKELGRFDEAEAVLRRGLSRFPNDIGIALERARLASHRRDWPEAVKRWNLVLTKYKHVMGAVAQAHALREMRQDAAAEELLLSVRSRYLSEPGIAIELARLAAARRDTAEALGRWKAVRDRFPLIPTGYLEGARLLIANDDIAQAEAMLVDAVDRFKYDALPMILYAEAAEARRDLEEADRRWNAVRTRFPDRAEGYRRGAAVALQLGRRAEAEQLQASAGRAKG